MTTKTYFDEYTECEITVEEMNRKEAISCAVDFIENIEFVHAINQPETAADMSVYIEYKDGSFYSNIGGDIEGTFKKTNIKAIIMDDGYEYHIYGDYTMSENMIPEVA